MKRQSIATAIVFALLLSLAPLAPAQAAKTHVADTVHDISGNPLAGKITFILTQKSASTPDGLVVASPSVSAVLDSAGHFDVYLYPSTSLSPVSYYQVYVTAGAGNQTFLGVYNIPSSASVVTLAPYKVTDTNLAAQYTFADAPSVLALTSAVSTATFESLLGATTSGTLPKRSGTGLADSALSEGSTQITSTKQISAPSFVGNGAALTGIGTGTGGVINTGSTTIGADSGSAGTGVIDFQIGGASKVRLNNDGTLSGSAVDSLLSDVSRCEPSEGCFDANAPPYSAVPNVTTDQTAAIQAVTDAVGAYLAGGRAAVLRLTPGKYRVSRAPVQNGTFDAQVTLPVIPQSARAALTIESKTQCHSTFPFAGGPGCVTFETTLTGQSYSTSYGKPAVFGGPDAIHGTSAGLASYLSVRFRGVGFEAPQDPSVMAVNGEMLDQLIFENCSWGTTDPNLGTASQVVPTHPTGIAVLGPREYFEGTMWLGTNTMAGYYGCFPIDEYTNGVGDMFAGQCVVNFNVSGSFYTFPVVNIATSIRGKYDLAHVDPQTGVGNIPDGLIASGFLPIKITMRIEDGPAAGNWGKIYNVLDGRNQLRGKFEYVRVNSVVGLSGTDGMVTTPLHNLGGYGAEFINLDGPSLARPITQAQFVAASSTALASVPFTVNPLAASWTVFSGGFNANGNGAVIGTNAGANRAVVDSGVSDGKVSARCYFASASGSCGFIFRASDANNYYVFEVDSGGTYQLTKFVAGVGSAVTGCSGTAGSPANPFSTQREIPIGALMTGSTFRILMNDNALCTPTDSFNSTATKHGIDTSGTVATVSDFVFTK